MRRGARDFEIWESMEDAIEHYANFATCEIRAEAKMWAGATPSPIHILLVYYGYWYQDQYIIEVQNSDVLNSDLQPLFCLTHL